MKASCLILALALPLSSAAAATTTPTAALGVTIPSATGGSASYSVGLSSDARFVLFLSRANNLTTNDSSNPWLDLFLRDRLMGTTALVSVDASQRGGGDANASAASVSDDGNLVAFESAATNLVPDDTNGVSDIFVRDVLNGTTRKISTGPAGEAARGASENPQLSADGRYVIYESLAGNLVVNDTNQTREIFLHDRVLGVNQRLSRPLALALAGTTPNAQGTAHSASLTPDARQVAYVRSIVDLSGRVIGSEILGWDAQTSNTTWISAGVMNNDLNRIPASCFLPTISADGRVVVFKESSGTNGVSLYRRAHPPLPDVPAQLIAANVSTQGWASVSHNGRFVAYQAVDGVHLWDADSSSNRLVLANTSGTRGRYGAHPVLSADSERLVFLVTSNLSSSIQLHETLLNRTTAALLRTDGRPAPVSGGVGALFSRDGRTIVFDSTDDSLVDADGNQESDVFAFNFDDGQMDCASLRATARAGRTPPAASGHAGGAISANGRVIAASSNDLGVTDTNRFPDFYVRDLGRGQQSFLGSSGVGTRDPVLSADGRYAAYMSVDLNLHQFWNPEEPAKVYRRDLHSGIEVLVHSDAIWTTNGPGIAISPDGTQVVFATRRFNAVSNGRANLYLRDFKTGVTTLVSPSRLPAATPDETWEADGDSMNPRFSPDGRWILFGSQASDLTTNSAHTGFGLYARDLVAGKTYLVASTLPNGRALSISADSRRVAAITPEAGVPRVILFDLETRIVTSIPETANARSVSLSGDGRWLAYDARPSGGWNIYVRDLVNQTNQLISSRAGSNPAVPTRDSSYPAISHDGRYVVFMSTASNLVAGDLNRVKDIFVRDRLRGVTLLASINRDGTGPGNGPSTLPVLAGDGRTVMFQSVASDLVEGDDNEASDLFVLTLGGADIDGDGMDDDWEAAYFGSLERTGSGDLDRDGTTDAAEYQLGTDPTNAGSVFQVITLTSETGLGTRLLWSAIPGRTYRVQHTDTLGAGQWVDAPEMVTAAGTTGTWLDAEAGGGGERFYRVVLVP